MPSLPEALSHGHTLAKPARRTDSTFCALCHAWFELSASTSSSTPHTQNQTGGGNDQEQEQRP